MNNLALTLITERKRRGLTQAQVAKSLGISRSYLAYFEKGQKPENSEVLEKLAKFYDLDPKELFELNVANNQASSNKNGKAFDLSDPEKALIIAVRLKNENKALKLTITLTTGQTFTTKAAIKASALAPLLVEGRKNKALTQGEAADLLGIARSSLSEIELGGAREPSPTVLRKMATLYDLDFEELLQIKVNKGQGITSLSKAEKELIDAVRSKDASKALKAIDQLIHA